MRFPLFLNGTGFGAQLRHFNLIYICSFIVTANARVYPMICTDKGLEMLCHHITSRVNSLTMQRISFSSGMVAAPIPDGNRFHIIVACFFEPLLRGNRVKYPSSVFLNNLGSVYKLILTIQLLPLGNKLASPLADGASADTKINSDIGGIYTEVFNIVPILQSFNMTL